MMQQHLCLICQSSPRKSYARIYAYTFPIGLSRPEAD